MLNYYNFEENQMHEDFKILKTTVQELKIQQEAHTNEIMSLNCKLDELKINQENNTFAKLTLSALSSYSRELDKLYGIHICSNCGGKGHKMIECTEECKGNCPRNYKSHLASKCPFLQCVTPEKVLQEDDDDGDIVKPKVALKNDKPKIRNDLPNPEMFVEPFNAGL